MDIYGVSLSPFFERCIIVADLKGGLGQLSLKGVGGGAMHSPEHMMHNPLGKIPYLDIGTDQMLPEGQVMAEFINEKLDGPDLVSDQPETAALQRLICRIVDLHIIEPILTMNRGAKGEERDACLASAHLGLDRFEHFFHPGTRAVGDDWSIADCALIPLVFHYLRATKSTDFSAWPKLEAWWSAVKDEAPVKESMERMQQSLDAIIAMRKAAAAQAKM